MSRLHAFGRSNKLLLCRPPQFPVRAPDMTAPDTRRILLASLTGTAVEFYDFYIYSTAAALVFGPLFFPASSASAQQMGHGSAARRAGRVHRRQRLLPAARARAERRTVPRLGLAPAVSGQRGAGDARAVGALKADRNAGVPRSGQGRDTAARADRHPVQAPSARDAGRDLRGGGVLRAILPRDRLCAGLRHQGAGLSARDLSRDRAAGDPVSRRRHHRIVRLGRPQRRDAHAGARLRGVPGGGRADGADARGGVAAGDPRLAGLRVVRDGVRLWPARWLVARSVSGRGALYRRVADLQSRWPNRPRTGAARRAGAGRARHRLCRAVSRRGRYSQPWRHRGDQAAARNSVIRALPWVRSASTVKPPMTTGSFAPVSTLIQVAGPIQPSRINRSSATTPAPVA